ncbi:hypothetical protein D3C80_683790 [compost metagenome]
MVDLQCDVQRLAGSAPGLFRLALQPEDARVEGQRRDTLVVLHAKAMGETVEMTAVGHALQHLFGMLPSLMLVAGEVQGEHPQSMHAQGHLGVVLQPQVIELPTLFQGHLVLAAAEIDRQVPGNRPQLTGHIVELAGQGSGADEGANGFAATSLNVITGTAQSQLEGHLQARARLGRLLEQGQRLAHITAVFLEQ